MRFPDFMHREANRIPASQQNTPDIEGYYYTAPDGSQMAFWTYKADRISKVHVHDYDEYMLVVEGEYTVSIDGIIHVLHAGDELIIPRGTMQGGSVKAGTRTIHAFGGTRVMPYDIVPYSEDMKQSVHDFLDKCFRDVGKLFEPKGRHMDYDDIQHNFELFLCMKNKDDIIGSVAVRRLYDTDCELKAMYLDKRYQGQRLGYHLLKRAVEDSRRMGFKRMYLDSMSSYERAVALYRSFGFRDTEQYNDNDKADVFMVLDL